MAESYTPPGSSTAYTVPELTDPADAPQAFRDFADSVQNVADMLTVSDHLADWTLADFDEGTLLAVDTVAAAADVTLTVPDNATVPLPVGFTVAVANLGGGGFKVKLAKGPGVIIQDQGFLQVEDYRITTLVKVATNSWLVQAGSATYTPPSGPQPAQISSPAPTGQYTDADGTWDYYEFTASGSLTLDRGGFADVLVVGGGGGGGIAPSAGGAGGGAGAHLYATDAYLPAGSLTVTIGAGGAAYTSVQGEGRLGNNGGASSIGNYYAPGGGGAGTKTVAGSDRLLRYSHAGLNGGSGGGAGGFETGSTAAAGLGIALGNDGGTGASQAGGGGGGAGAQGSSASSGAGGNGGAGSANSITGSSVTRAGGGGGHGSTTRGSGGTGGGGDATTGNGDSGTTNTGGGGGGGVGTGNAGGPGGSGIVIVRVKV